jgi:hypothetical protein
VKWSEATCALVTLQMLVDWEVDGVTIMAASILDSFRCMIAA